MVDSWIDHIGLRRDRYSNFVVYGNKYGEDPDTGRKRWFEGDTVRGLRSPEQIKEAIHNEAEFLSVEIDWVSVVPIIATLDWVTSAVLASTLGISLPDLPYASEMLEQRSLRQLGKVTIGVEWGYDLHGLVIPFERWVRLLHGDSWYFEMPYWYEGERFTGCWSFDRRTLEVTYDGEGQGWSGDLERIDVVSGPVLDGVDLAKATLLAQPPSDARSSANRVRPAK